MDVVRSLDQCFPPFAELAKKFEDAVKPYGFYIYETYRSFDRQLEIYKKGRELQNGLWVTIDAKKIATKAKPGTSFHQYSTALDLIPDGDETKQGIQWSWEDTMKDSTGKIIPVPWDEIGKISLKIGLEAGMYWTKFPDQPHHQLSYGYTTKELLPILTNEGLPAVWKKFYSKIKANPSTVTVPVEVKPEPPKEPTIEPKKEEVVQQPPEVKQPVVELVKPVETKSIWIIIFELIMKLFIKK